MTRKVGDDVSTNDVVWAAAERIGKASNAQDVNRICDYLISKHWFQTAGDLRVARESAQEWLALEVPSRLKIAIQEVLDAPLETAYSPGKTRGQGGPDQSTDQPARAMTRNSPLDSALEYRTSTVEADQLAVQQAFYGQEAVEQVQVEDHVLTTSDASTYHDPSCNGIDTQTYDSPYDTEVPDDAAAAHAAAWEAYYAANGYYGYETTEQPASEGWDYSSYDNSAQPHEDVVEAQEVVIEEAIAVESEGETPCESALPAQCETWSCAQCTYINRIDVSFCEMCCGHYSLCHAAQLSPPGVSTLDENERTEVSSDVVVADLHDSNTPMEATQDESSFYQDPVVHAADSQDVALLVPPTQPTCTLTLESPLYVSIPSPSKPMSPLYSPSAPDFEEPTVQVEHSSKSPDLLLDGGKTAEVSAPTPVVVAAPSPSPPKVDYRSLAFKRTPSIPSTSVNALAQGGGISSPSRSHTEFTF